MDKLVYLLYPLLLLLLLWGSRWQGRGQWNEDAFSHEQCKLWQGFCTVCILLHHASQRTTSPWIAKAYYRPGLGTFFHTGYLFVAFFLLCSGYGLYTSWKNKPDYLRGFFRRRVLPVVAAFYTTNWLYLIIRLLTGEQMTTARLWWFLLGAQQANDAWFAVALPVFYLMFWLCFRLIRKEGWAIAGVFALVLCWMVAGAAVGPNDWVLKGEWWYNTAVFFPLGMVYAKYRRPIARAAKRHYWLLLIGAAALCPLLYLLSRRIITLFPFSCRGVEWLPERIGRRMLGASGQIAMGLAFVSLLALLGMKLKLKNRALSLLGALTLELYLIHYILINLFSYKFFAMKPSPLYIPNAFFFVLAAAACSLPAALLLRKALHPTQPLPWGRKAPKER